MKLALNLPLNRVSFGQVSTLLLRTIFEQEKTTGATHDIFLFPIGPVDVSSQTPNPEFNQWIVSKIANAMENYSRDIPIFKLWHLNGSLESHSTKQSLLSFYELDEPTKVELNIARNNKLFFSSKYSCDIFNKAGGQASYMPLGFDSYNFKALDKKYFNDDRIVFNLCGKFEKRKNHEKVIRAWIKKFGGNSKYSLQCAIFNQFLNEQQNQQLIGNVLQGNKPFNVNFFPMMNENALYNDFLNSGDIILGLSGAEGFGLPEFQSVAIGKHSILLQAHAYKDWATDDMTNWVSPIGKIQAYDNMFFHKGQPFNQGNIFDFNEDEFIFACEKAIKNVESSRVNKPGLTLQETFSKEKFVNSVIASIN